MFLWLSRAAAVRKREKKKRRRRRRRTTRGTIWSLSFSPTTPCAIHNRRRRRRRRHTISPPSSSLCLLRQESTSSSVLFLFLFLLLSFGFSTSNGHPRRRRRQRRPFPLSFFFGPSAIHGRVRLLFSSLRPVRTVKQRTITPIQNKTKEEKKRKRERGPHRFCIFVLGLCLNLLLLRHQQRSFMSRIVVKVSSSLWITALRLFLFPYPL